MVGFAQYTRTYETRLGRMPFYRKGARGPDQLETFAARKGREYAANAGRIRDMRFAQSNEFNVDRALRSQREKYLSDQVGAVSDPRMLEGLRGRTGLKLSRTGGALSVFEKPGVVKGDAPMSLTVAGLAALDKASAVRRARGRQRGRQQRAADEGFYAPDIGEIEARFTRDAQAATKAARERAEYEAANKIQTVASLLLKNRSKGGKSSLPPLPKLKTSTFTQPQLKPTVQVPVRPTTANQSPRKHLDKLTQGARGFVQQEVKARTPQKKFTGKGSQEKNRLQELLQQGEDMGIGMRGKPS